MKCFVISPIGEEGSEVRTHADDVFEHVIEPALEHFGIEAIRSDQMNEPGRISDHMYRAIFEYDLCVAVLTFANPNVYYELAVAQSASRPVVILVEKGSSLPFDVKDFRTLTYDLRITTFKQRTHINRLIGMLDELKQLGWRGDDVFRHTGATNAHPFTSMFSHTESRSTNRLESTRSTSLTSVERSNLCRQDMSSAPFGTTPAQTRSSRTGLSRLIAPRRNGTRAPSTLAARRARSGASTLHWLARTQRYFSTVGFKQTKFTRRCSEHFILQRVNTESGYDRSLPGRKTSSLVGAA